MSEKQSEFLEDEKAEEFDSPPSEAPKTKGSSGSIEKRDDQDSTEKDRQESLEENQNSTKKEGSKLGQLEKIASKGKSERKLLSLKELKKLRETAKQFMLANSFVKAMDTIHKMEESCPPEYSAMVFGWKASVEFDTAKMLLMNDSSSIPKARDPVLCMEILQSSVKNAVEAARIFPNCLEFSVVLAQTLQFQKEYQRVKEICDRALSLKPTELVNNTGGSVKKEAAKMEIKALEKIKKSAEKELSKSNAMDSGNSESTRNVSSAEPSTTDGMPARSRRNVN